MGGELLGGALAAGMTQRDADASQKRVLNGMFSVLVDPGALADRAAFEAIPAESVDYAVMENTSRAAVVPVAMGWSDIGNWQALHAARPHDAAGNSVTGRAELVGCRNVLVESDGPRVSVVGLEGVIVVVNGNEVLVTSADGAQLVGKLDGATNQ